MKGFHARGMIVQEGLEFLFDPALTAQPDVRAAGSTGKSAAESTPAAAAEFTQAAMRKKIETTMLRAQTNRLQSSWGSES